MESERFMRAQENYLRSYNDPIYIQERLIQERISCFSYRIKRHLTQNTILEMLKEELETLPFIKRNITGGEVASKQIQCAKPERKADTDLP